MDWLQSHASVFLFLSAASLALFSFLAVTTWSENRRRERESFYKSETIKKIAELHQDNADNALSLMRELEKSDLRKRREGLKLGGLITTAVGISLLIFHVVAKSAAFIVGLLPFLVGVTLLLYVYALASKD